MDHFQVFSANQTNMLLHFIHSPWRAEFDFSLIAKKYIIDSFLSDIECLLALC